MSETTQTLLERAAALPIDERIELVQAIWDTIAAEPDQHETTDAQLAELERRLELYRANPDDVIPWEEVQARALTRHKGAIS